MVNFVSCEGCDYHEEGSHYQDPLHRRSLLPDGRHKVSIEHLSRDLDNAILDHDNALSHTAQETGYSDCRIRHILRTWRLVSLILPAVER